MKPNNNFAAARIQYLARGQMYHDIIAKTIIGLIMIIPVFIKLGIKSENPNELKNIIQLQVRFWRIIYLCNNIPLEVSWDS